MLEQTNNIKRYPQQQVLFVKVLRESLIQKRIAWPPVAIRFDEVIISGNQVGISAQRQSGFLRHQDDISKLLKAIPACPFLFGMPCDSVLPVSGHGMPKTLPSKP